MHSHRIIALAVTAVLTVAASPADLYAQSCAPGTFRAIGSTLFFTADDGVHSCELWKTDGTPEGTVLVKDINPETFGRISNMVPVGSTLFFTADDGMHGTELWASDGTEAGTVMVRDINPGSASTFFRDSPVAYDGRLFFGANDGEHGEELWVSDGTEAGTVMLKDIHPDGWSAPIDFEVAGGTLFFIADDGTHGYELWASDGTAEGTRLVVDLHPGPGGGVDALVTAGDRLFLSSGTLHVSDGTEAGTQALGVDADLGGTGHIAPKQDIDGVLYFICQGELCRSDGTVAGTYLVRDIAPGVYTFDTTGEQGNRLDFGVVGDRLILSADDRSHSFEPWISDGTEEGTVLLRDISPDGGSSTPFSFSEYDGAVYFQADDGEHGWELWRSDGTTEGTVMVRDLNPGPGHSNPGKAVRYYTGGGYTFGGSDDRNLNMFEFDGRLFFSADDGTHGRELWVSDGTAEGTELFKDFFPESSTPVDPGAETHALSLTSFPNPASRTMSLQLAVPITGEVTVEVYDVLGRRVAVLHDGPLAAGPHALRFDAAALPSGVYVVRAVAPAGVVTRRVTLLR